MLPAVPTFPIAATFGAVLSFVNVGTTNVSDLLPALSSAHAVTLCVPSAVIVKLPLVAFIVFSTPFSVYFNLVVLVSVPPAVSAIFTVTVPT